MQMTSRSVVVSDTWHYHVLFINSLLRRFTQLLVVNHEQFFMQMTHKSKHNNAGFTKWLEILAGEYFPQKFLWNENVDLKSSASNVYGSEGNAVNRETEATATTNIYRGSDKILQLQWKRNRWREGSPTADNSRQYNSQQKRWGEATLEVYIQTYLLRYNDRQQKFTTTRPKKCTWGISFQRTEDSRSAFWP